ncbi:MAG: FAD-dependent monooxygenase [Paracoccaceae bacterium]
MLKGQSIAVVGAGIAGLASSIAMAHRGAHVRVFEAANKIAEIGAGLQISPNGVAVLDALGLGDQLRSIAMVCNTVILRDYKHGNRVLRLDLRKSGAGRPYLLLHRADLIGLLVEAAKDAGVKIALGRGVDRIVDGTADVRLVFIDGTAETVDLLIGADGLHSKLRPVLNGAQQADFTGQVAWRALVKRSNSPAVNVYMGPGRHLVTYPLRGGTMTNIVAVEERAEWARESWSHPGDIVKLRATFSTFCPEVRDLLEQVKDCNLWGLFRHRVAENWTGHHCALVGDAAHPSLPFLAQGANMALEDAWVLADCLASLPFADALPRYQSRRHARVNLLVGAANANARNYHLRNPLLRFVAHTGLRTLGVVAPQLMLRKFDWIYNHDVTRDS